MSSVADHKQMKIVYAALLAVGSFFLLAFLFAYWQIAYYTPAGFQGTGHATAITKPLVLSACSLLGIFSKSILDAVSQHKSRRDRLVFTDVFNLRSLLRAIVVCPVVIISFYQSIQAISDLMLVGLIAYQNGFFFETVLQDREHTRNHNG
jgi:hypothetical protein